MSKPIFAGVAAVVGFWSFVAFGIFFPQLLIAVGVILCLLGISIGVFLLGFVLSDGK